MSDIYKDPAVCKVCCTHVIDRGVECDGKCKRWYHPDCVKITSDEYKKIADGVVKTWLCGRADCAVPQPDSHVETLNQILKKFDSLASKEDVLKMSNDITALRHDISNLSKTVSDLAPRLTQAENEIVSIKQAISNLKSSPVTNIEEFCSEINDRSNRKRNAILYNIPESNSRGINEQKSHDRNIISNIFGSFGLDNIQFSFFRLGKKSSPKARPVKVILQNSDVANDFFKKFNKESLADNLSNVTISRDKTKQERQYLDEIRKELDRRLGSGEPDLTIKYINGTPTIVNKPKN